MCGIAALIASKDGLPDSVIRAMTHLIAHRGPDDEGFALFKDAQRPLLAGGPDTPSAVYQADYSYCPRAPRAESTTGYRVLFGHRRLSILDLSPAGHQPLSIENGRYWIVYNGEVYNYLELRTELEAAGHTFGSHSDTEVILKAYAVWGEACLQRFNGMFAFAIYDVEQRSLFAARDRFSVKPLYYWWSPTGVLALASEIKQFTVLPGWKPVVQRQRAYDFLTTGMTDHAQETLFRGVHQIRGGECLSLDLHSQDLQIKRWYQLPLERFSGTEADAALELRRLLKDAVRLRLRSDVDVGFCLSGGLDSSSIVCLAHEIHQETAATNRQKSFSACSHEKAYDERRYIEIINQNCNLASHYTYPSLDKLFEIAPTITWIQDEPYGSTSIYAQWRVFELVKESGVKVMLDGQGADEQLGGYFGFFTHRLADLFYSLRWRQFFREAHHIRTRHGDVVPPGPKAFRRILRHTLREAVGATKPRRARCAAWLNLEQLMVEDRLPFADSTYESFQAQSLRQITCSNIPMLLRYEDRDSMAHGVESRTPFMDYRLVEFLTSLPSHFKIHEGVTKRVMREGMKGTLPDEIRLRMDKLGFATPEEVWLRKHNPALFLRHIESAIEQSKGILKPDTLKLAQQVVAGEAPFSFWTWRLVSFGMWMDRFGMHV